MTLTGPERNAALYALNKAAAQAAVDGDMGLLALLKAVIKKVEAA